jgi:hypothetical protein
MKSINKKQPTNKIAANKPADINDRTVRGSGFTYTENQHPTDKSIPIEKAKEQDIVKLPDLGQKNRP